ncbi:MAG: biotin--[acetyl-CoA-carboxylase] ligase [Aaplasma endosymbiont of Hyalomma asiaticum]
MIYEPKHHTMTINAFTIHNVGVTGSTNLDAIKLAKNGAQTGTVVIADEQTCGSGRHQRQWVSPKGNLYFSIVLREHLHVPTISFAAALSVGMVIEQIFLDHYRHKKIPSINYKWPNDVVVDDKKICGILLQAESQKNEIQWMVCGIGVNVLSSPAYATHICHHCPDVTLPPQKLLCMVLESFTKVMDLYMANGFSLLRRLWLKRAHKINEQVSIVTSSGTVYEGKFVDIHPEDGSVVLKSGSNILNIDYGEML